MKLFLFIASFICFGKYQKATDDVVVMKLIKADFKIESPVGISCDDFYNSLKWEIDTFYISDTLKQQMVLDFIYSATPYPYNVKEYNGPDTRARMFISYQSGKVDSLCLGYNNDFLLNNKPMFLPNRDLIIMLDQLKK